MTQPELDGIPTEEFILYLTLMLCSIGSTVLVLLVTWSGFGNEERDHGDEDVTDQGPSNVETDLADRESDDEEEDGNGSQNTNYATVGRRNGKRTEVIPVGPPQPPLTDQGPSNDETDLADRETVIDEEDGNGLSPGGAQSRVTDQGPSNDETDLDADRESDEEGEDWNVTDQGPSNDETDLDADRESDEEGEDWNDGLSNDAFRRTHSSQSLSSTGSNDQKVEEAAREIAEANSIENLLEAWELAFKNLVHCQKGFTSFPNLEQFSKFILQYQNSTEEKSRKAKVVGWVYVYLKSDKHSKLREKLLNNFELVSEDDEVNFQNMVKCAKGDFHTSASDFLIGMFEGFPDSSPGELDKTTVVSCFNDLLENFKNKGTHPRDKETEKLFDILFLFATYKFFPECIKDIKKISDKRDKLIKLLKLTTTDADFYFGENSQVPESLKNLLQKIDDEVKKAAQFTESTMSADAAPSNQSSELPASGSYI